MLFSFTSSAFAISQENEDIYLSQKENQQIVNDIRKENPNALIFNSQEEADEYMKVLDNPIVTVNEINQNFRAATKKKQLNIKLGMASVNVHYVYNVLKGGYVGNVVKGLEYSNFTGITIGMDYKQQLLKVIKHSSTEIKTDIAFTIDYYLLINGGVKINTKQARYNVYHDVRNDSIRLVKIYG